MVVESVLLIMSKGYVYFRTNFQRTTLYIGFTSNLARRIWEHKQGKGSEFTSKYKLAILVYTEEFDSIVDAIDREKQLKNWHKEWKWNLVKQHNPKLEDWYETLRG
jgi:putative endonuclease